LNPNCNNNNRLTQTQCNTLLAQQSTGTFDPATFANQQGVNLATVNNFDLANCLQGLPVNPNNFILQNIQIDQNLPVTTLPTVAGSLGSNLGNNFYYRSSYQSEQSYYSEDTPLALGTGTSTTTTTTNTDSSHYSYLFNSTSYLAVLITLCVLCGLMCGVFIKLFIKQRKLDNK